MKCMFCAEPVFGDTCMTVPGADVAHQKCYLANEALKRTFKDLNISGLSDEEFLELKELVLAEENVRFKAQDEDDVELF